MWLGKPAKASFSDPLPIVSDKISSAIFPLTNTLGYGSTTLLSGQTVNKDHQSSRVVLGEFLSDAKPAEVGAKNLLLVLEVAL